MIVAYDGTDFFGFQRQPDRRTVQGVLEEAITRIAGHPVQLVGAGEPMRAYTPGDRCVTLTPLTRCPWTAGHPY